MGNSVKVGQTTAKSQGRAPEHYTQLVDCNEERFQVGSAGAVAIEQLVAARLDAHCIRGGIPKLKRLRCECQLCRR